MYFMLLFCLNIFADINRFIKKYSKRTAVLSIFNINLISCKSILVEERLKLQMHVCIT